MLSFTSVFGKDLNSFCRTMEHISIWIDRWMNPVEDLEYFDYSHQFDSLADRARLKLPTAATERDIISAIDRVMFKEDGYRVSHNFYSHTNSYLHKVSSMSYELITLLVNAILLIQWKPLNRETHLL